MKKLNLLLMTMLLMISFSITASAAERNDITIDGVHTKNNPVVTVKDGYTTAINKSIEKVVSNEYVDVKLTLKSTKSTIPKTNDSNNMIAILAILMISGGFMILCRKKPGKAFLSLTLIISLIPALSPAMTTAHTQSMDPVYTTTENLSDETLKSFTFDKVISVSKGNSDTIKDDNGKVRSIKWKLNDENTEQSFVYRLLLNENIPDNLIDKKINVSSAKLDFKDTDGKTASMTYPNVSFKLKETATPVPSPAPFTLTYAPNGGEGQDIILQPAVDSWVTVAENSFTKTDYTFSHWNTAANDSGTSYGPGESFPMPAADIILYAQWEADIPVTYMVHYDANGGSGSYIDSNIRSGDHYTVKAPSAIGINKAGNTFLYWNTEADGSGTSYSPGTNFIITNDITLYAQWQVMPPD